MASVPVAAVSTASSFTLDGNTLALTGVTSWPLVVGDEIATATASATILFKDGSNVTLAPKSTLKITGKEVSPIVLIESGSVDYKLVKDSKVSILRLEDAQLPDFTGRLPSGNHTATWATATAAAGGGGGALGVGLASHSVVSSGSSSLVGSLSSSPATTPVATSTTTTDTTDLTVRALSLSKYK